MADKVKVTLIKSTIGAVPKNKNAATQGALRKVAPYVNVEEA